MRLQDPMFTSAPGSSQHPSVRAVLLHGPQAPSQYPPSVISRPSITIMGQTRPQRHQAGPHNYSPQGSLGRNPGMGPTRSQQRTATLSSADIGRPRNSDEAPSSEGSGRSLTTVTEERSLGPDTSLTTTTQSRSRSTMSDKSSGNVHQALNVRKKRPRLNT